MLTAKRVDDERQEDQTMIDHVSAGVPDVGSAADFYGPVLAALRASGAIGP